MYPDKFAITYTVKNEAALLPDAIAHHLSIGCSRIYLFFDDTTDNSRDLIADIRHVTSQDSVHPDSLRDPPAWIGELLPRWSESMDVRKRINTFTAVELARRDGIEWLICIDPDELLLLHDGPGNHAGDCREFFATVTDTIDQILVPNAEAVPTGAGSGQPFVDCTLFLRRFPVTELLWRYSSALFRLFVPSPRLRAWYDHWFYRLRFLGSLPRLMRHPVTGEYIPAGYFLGYSNHKSFIRTSAAKEFKFNIHKWEGFRRKPRSARRGLLLHYDLPNAEYFCSKFRQRHPAMLVKAFFCRHMFATIARDLSFDTVRRFFLDNVCIADENIVSRLRRQRILREVTFIADAMKARRNDTSPTPWRR